MKMDRLIAAVPDLASYQPHTGIGRVLHTLQLGWGERVQLAHATFEAHWLPVLRNSPYGVRTSAPADLVLLPKLTGAEALRDAHGVPSIVVVHDIGIVDCPLDREGMGWLTRQTVIRSFHGLKYASRIIADSHFTRSRLVEHLPETASKITVIPPAVASGFVDDLALSKEAARSILGSLSATLQACSGGANARGAKTPGTDWSLGDPLLVTVGSEIPRKNVPMLLQVFAQVKRWHPGAQLLKIGRAGGEAWRAKTLAAVQAHGLQVGRDVIIMEDIEDETLAIAYRAADAFVSTSLYEGFGLPALEALALGTPVIVTNRAAFRETVGAAGRLVEPEVGAFVDAIQQALAEPCGPAASESNNRRRNAARRYALDQMADCYLSVMQEAVHE